jgi:hypothetical protein
LARWLMTGSQSKAAPMTRTSATSAAATPRTESSEITTQLLAAEIAQSWKRRPGPGARAAAGAPWLTTRPSHVLRHCSREDGQQHSASSVAPSTRIAPLATSAAPFLGIRWRRNPNAEENAPQASCRGHTYNSCGKLGASPIPTLGETLPSMRSMIHASDFSCAADSRRAW